MKKTISIIVILLTTHFVLAKTLSVTSPTTITGILAYTTYHNGDIAIEVKDPAEGCSGGFWINSQDVGLQNTLSIILSAKHTASKVKLYGDKDDIWSGSSTPYCHLYLIYEL